MSYQTHSQNYNIKEIILAQVLRIKNKSYIQSFTGNERKKKTRENTKMDGLIL